MQAVVGLEGREGRAPQPSAPVPTVKSPSSATVAGTDVVGKADSIAYLSAQAEIAAHRHGTRVQELLGIRWVEEDRQWQMRFKTDKDIGTHGGASSITVNAATGKVERVKFGDQSAFGNKVDQWLGALHMGHIGQGWGHRLYQVFLAMIGLAVTVLSGTGVYLWWKGRQQRAKALQKVTR